MKSAKKSKITTVLAVVICLILIITVVGLVFKTTKKADKNENNLLKDRDFYITLNGEIVEDNSVYHMHPENPFNVLVFGKKDFVDYKIEIKKNEACDFKFTQNGKENTYKEMITDLSKAFTISDIDGGFKIQPKSNNLAEILDFCLGGDAIQIDLNSSDWSMPLFKLIISSKKGNYSVTLLLKWIQADSVNLNFGEVVF